MIRVQSLWQRGAVDFMRSPLAIVGLLILAVIVLAALLAPWITPQNPYDLMQLDVLDARLAPGATSGEGHYTYWLGTDGQGRDLYSAIVYGLRISLLVGVGSALIAAVIGTLLGLVSAYAGGWVDALLMRLVDLLLSFPGILMALMILAWLGKGVGNVVLTWWCWSGRTTHVPRVARRWWKAAVSTSRPPAARASAAGASWSGISCPTACRH
jgi:peptide/nickel transport system permease protein